MGFKWYNTAFNNIDTGIARPSAGVVEINNGNDGQLRDLIARTITATVIFPTADPHVVGAAYWAGGVLTRSNG
jgi:hypothetical protein